MIKLVRLDKLQKQNLQAMTKTEGWKVIQEAMALEIEVENVKLLNWSFKFDEEGEIVKKNIMEFQKKQAQVGLMKDFLLFVYDPTMINPESDNSLSS